MKFDVILADPPWRFKNWTMQAQAKKDEKWARRNGRSPYAVMTTEDIAGLPVGDIAAKDCILFLWATYPKLPDAFEVMAGWGFTYKSVAFTWVKNNPSGVGFKLGLGYWTRGNPEIVLLGTRGKPKRVCNRVPNLVIAPVSRHSRKPDDVHVRIEQLMGDLPRVELFARRPYPGWVTVGNDIDGVDIRDSLAGLAMDSTCGVNQKAPALRPGL